MEKHLLTGSRIPVFFMIILFLVLLSSCRGSEPGQSVMLGNYAYNQGRYQKSTLLYLNSLEAGKFEPWI